VAGSTILGKRVTELLDVRHAVLLGDPSFFDHEGGAVDGRDTPDVVPAALRAVGL
jgi:hypothetical protein